MLYVNTRIVGYICIYLYPSILMHVCVCLCVRVCGIYMCVYYMGVVCAWLPHKHSLELYPWPDYDCKKKKHNCIHKKTNKQVLVNLVPHLQAHRCRGSGCYGDMSLKR